VEELEPHVKGVRDHVAELQEPPDGLVQFREVAG
jgi:hypothetical protein